jgi:hypothetical protein
MVLRRCAHRLLIGAAMVVALASGTGIAQASPDPGMPPVQPDIDEWLVQYPTTFVNPMDEGGPAAEWGGTGMYCENLFAHCS